MWGALFPGQGSQQVGMGKFLYENFPIAKQTFEEASDAISLNLKKLCFEGPDSDLALTENTQPALLTCSTATFRVLKEVSPIPILAGAGHSIGEYAAAVTAGSLSLAQGARAVRTRGQAMQRAVPVGQGAMCAVLGLSDGQVLQLCGWAMKQSGLGPLEPANFNSPGQVVISGSAAAMEWLRANAKADLFLPESPRLKLIPLNVSAPFHCSLMKPAEEEMAQVLGEMPMREASYLIVQNFTAHETRDPKVLKSNLISQVSGPVRWTQCVTRLHELGVRRAIEFGAGKVLSGLLKKIDSHPISTFNINSLEDLRNLEKTQLEAVPQ